MRLLLALGGFRHLDLGAVDGALTTGFDRAAMQERNDGNRESEHASHDESSLSTPQVDHDARKCRADR